jgi:hypothetical protein
MDDEFLKLKSVFVETGCCKVNIQFRFFFVNADFRPLFLFAEVVLPWFVYADITLETFTLNTPNNVAVFVTDAPAKREPMICSLSKSDKSPTF